jgi:hypothetical protein
MNSADSIRMESVSLYSEARNEYLKQMASWLSSPIVEFFRTEYQTISTKDPAKAMSAFQTWCADVPKWNQDIIDKNVAIILDTCRCDYVEELMTAVFIAHTKMLTAIRVSSKQKKMKITLPKLDHFLHRVFIECARGFWKAPFLFLESIPFIEKQKNVLQMETLCIEALSGAVRSLLPVKSILTEYLAEDEGDEEEEKEEEEPIVAPKPKVKKTPLPLASTIATLAPQSSTTVAPVSVMIPSTITTIAPVPSTITTIDPVPSTITTITPLRSTIATMIPLPIPLEPHSAILPAIKPGFTAEKVEEASTMRIDTEPSVHFTPYDTVFDDTKESGNEIRYTPKVSVEDKPPSNWGLEEEEDLPKLQIGTEGTALSLDEMEDLEAPPAPPVEEDVAFAVGGEFEELS